MPKGYVISRVDITNPEAYARYAAAATKAITNHGGKPLARGGRSEALEGKARARNVVLEFDSYEAARRYARPSDLRRRARCARELPRSRWFWSRESDDAEGLLDRPRGRARSRDLPAIRQGQRRLRSPNSGPASWSAPASMSSPRARRRRAMSSSSFATTRPRSPATKSEEYRAAAKLRDAAAAVDLVIAEGYDGLPPG